MRKLIGKGAFTKAYQVAEDKVELVSICPTKEAYAEFGQHIPFVPRIAIKGHDRTGAAIYDMPLYPKMKAPKQQLNAEGYTLYRKLETLFRSRLISLSSSNYNYQTVYRMFDELDIAQETKEQLQDLLGIVCNYVDTETIRFEISRRNVTCDENGNLILLDCFFCARTLQRSRVRTFIM